MVALALSQYQMVALALLWRLKSHHPSSLDPTVRLVEPAPQTPRCYQAGSS